MLIDIAVPRDIDPGTRRISSRQAFRHRWTQRSARRFIARRMDEIHSCKAHPGTGAFWLAIVEVLEMLPIIADIRQRAEAIRLAELEKTLRRMPDLTDAEHRTYLVLPTRLLKKILDRPTHAVAPESLCPHAPALRDHALRTLFELKPETGTCWISGTLPDFSRR